MTGRTFGRVGAFAAAVTMGVAVGSVSALPASAETLADAMIAAYRNSHLLEQNRAVLRASDEDVAVNVSALRPTLGLQAQGVTANYKSSSTAYKNLYGTIGLQASMTLYDFGRTRAAIEASKQTVLATQEALTGVEQNVLLAAVQAYMNVRSTQEVVSLNQSNVGVLEQQLKASKDRFDVGEITNTDVAQSQAALAAARSQLTASQGQLAMAREAYKAATGHYPGRLAPPPHAPQLPRTQSQAVQIAQRNHPDLKSAQYQVKAAEYMAQQAKDEIRPSLSASAQYGVDDLGNDAASATVTLTQPIYAGGKISALYRKALAQEDQNKAGLMQTSVTVTQNVGNAWAQLAVARSSISAYDEQIRAAQTAYNGVKEEAKLGSRTTLDVLNAEQSLLDARSSRVTAGTDEYVAVYQLLSSMGLLTAQHLKLGVPTYDASAYYNQVKNAPATSVYGKRLDKVMKSIGR
ncbi:TolC family outer membrane protein [Acidimangrovimonas sediminis]|uniref:TolC family outer membrane protein n=1 Tax=Acidimangrovimonas sediminis TaxID=2056283 RepID=UPI001E4A6EC8|nr:TolC family outer membrane protein [Acidimangrovimonas sediminis]